MDLLQEPSIDYIKARFLQDPHDNIIPPSARTRVRRSADNADYHSETDAGTI
jgi:hypothetical protein